MGCFALTFTKTISFSYNKISYIKNYVKRRRPLKLSQQRKFLVYREVSDVLLNISLNSLNVKFWIGIVLALFLIFNTGLFFYNIFFKKLLVFSKKRET